MPSNYLKIEDSPPVLGMNTVDDPKLLKPGECVRLVNMYPGEPPVPRKGCSGVLLTGSSTWRFIPPAISIEFSSTVCIAVWVYDTSGSTYKLLIFDSTTAGANTNLGAASFSTTPLFSMCAIHSSVYCIASKAMATWKSSNTALSHKVIESATIVRDMCISVAGAVNAVTQVGDNSTGVFDVGDAFSYAFQYVRRTDSAAFEAGSTPSGMILPPGITGMPKEVTTLQPGACIGIESALNRKTILVSNTGSTKYYANIDISNSHTQAIAQGATHIRVTRSRRFADTTLASAATHFFVKDLPAGVATTTYTDKISDNSLSGELNQLITGYTVAPAARFVEYIKGRLWLLAEGGYAYYSETPNGGGEYSTSLALDYPQAWASLYKPTTYYCDIDHADGQKAMGMARLGDDLYFFKERKIFALFGGDPTNSAPTSISDTIGLAFPYTLTKADVKGVFGNCLLFLSNEGPMVIQEGGHLKSFSQFKIVQLWPDKSTELFGDLDTQLDWITQNCTASYWQNVWWLLYRTYAGINKVYGYYFNPELVNNPDAPKGAFEVELAQV